MTRTGTAFYYSWGMSRASLTETAARSGRLLLVASVLTMIVAASSVASPERDTRAEEKIPEDCTYVTYSDPVVKRPFLGGPTVEVCGSFHNDALTVRRGGGGGTKIWAGPGSDEIDDRNGAVNLIMAGDRRDAVKIDVCKGLHGVQDNIQGAVAKVTKVRVKCPGTKDSDRTLSQRKVIYPRTTPAVGCGRSQGRRYVEILDPELRAVDATRNVDFQKVAFRALLYKQTASGEWSLNMSTAWLWDHTFDEQIVAFPGNYWRSLTGDTRTRMFVSLYPTAAGVYEVRFQYRWFAATV